MTWILTITVFKDKFCFKQQEVGGCSQLPIIYPLTRLGQTLVRFFSSPKAPELWLTNIKQVLSAEYLSLTAPSKNDPTSKKNISCWSILLFPPVHHLSFSPTKFLLGLLSLLYKRKVFPCLILRYFVDPEMEAFSLQYSFWIKLLFT